MNTADRASPTVSSTPSTNTSKTSLTSPAPAPLASKQHTSAHILLHLSGTPTGSCATTASNQSSSGVCVYTGSVPWSLGRAFCIDLSAASAHPFSSSATVWGRSKRLPTLTSPSAVRRGILSCGSISRRPSTGLGRSWRRCWAAMFSSPIRRMMSAR